MDNFFCASLKGGGGDDDAHRTHIINAHTYIMCVCVRDMLYISFTIISTPARPTNFIGCTVAPFVRMCEKKRERESARAHLYIDTFSLSL